MAIFASRTVEESESVLMRKIHARIQRKRVWHFLRTLKRRPAQTLTWSYWHSSMQPHPDWEGFHPAEFYQNRTFCWSDLCAALTVYDFGKGLRVSFSQLEDLSHTRLPSFYLDGLPLPADSVRQIQGNILITLPPSVRGIHTLSWNFPEISAQVKNSRHGWALEEIIVEPNHPEHLPEFRPFSPVKRLTDTDSVYFLHIGKSAGTSLRLILQNAWTTREMADPFSIHYLNRQFLNTESYQKNWRLCCSHLGWETVAKAPHTPKVITVLREPVDRLLSLFHFKHAIHRLPNGLDFEQFLTEFCTGHAAIQKNHYDLMAMYFTKEPLYNAPNMDALIHSLDCIADEALTNLRLCTVAGLTERMDDTINLICWKLGILPPNTTPRLNPTTRPSQHDTLSPSVQRKLTDLCRVDTLLYEESQKLFHLQFSEMVETLSTISGQSLDTGALRAFLRAQFLSHLAEQSSVDNIHWHPCDVFHGDGLHDRECHEGRFLRWTGAASAEFLFGRPKGASRWSCRIHLHPSAPYKHILEASIAVNGRTLSTSRRLGRQGSCLLAEISEQDVSATSDGILRVQLRSPLTGVPGETRRLGLALSQIQIEPV